MRSRVAIAGHPIHPMLVPIPIGLFVGAVAADIIYLLSDQNTMWYDIAFWALIGGVIGAVLAGAAGAGDAWLVARHTKARDMTMIHAALNGLAVVLFLVSIILRLDAGAVEGARFGAAFALSLVAIVALAVSGWIGGELSYRKHIGMIPDEATDEQRERELHLAGRR